MAVNSNAQAVRVSNDKMRPLADMFAQLYNRCKALSVESAAENWTAMFPAGSIDTIADGADVDGRAIITNDDNSKLMAMAGTYINYMEANANINRNIAVKIAVNPERTP